MIANEPMSCMWRAASMGNNGVRTTETAQRQRGNNENLGKRNQALRRRNAAFRHLPCGQRIPPGREQGD